MLSLLFSDKEALGWDQTIEAKYIGGERVYDMIISGQHYVSSTSDVLMELKAEGIYTTGTRIFKAYEKSDVERENPLIVKDYWPAVVYDTEVKTRRRILKSIQDSVERELVENGLLTSITWENVKVGKRKDHTEKVILRGRTPTDIYTFQAPPEKTSRKKNTKKSLLKGWASVTDCQPREAPEDLTLNRRTSIYHRRHCRIVYKEFATPYYELKSIKDMILVLEHSIDGMLV